MKILSVEYKRLLLTKIKIIYFFLVVMFFSNCNNPEYKRTDKICDKLYVETFTKFGSGAYGGDLMTEFLTDSVNFRVTIGDYDNYDNSIVYSCKNDSIIVDFITGRNSKIKVAKTKTYFLQQLIKENKFEK